MTMQKELRTMVRRAAQLDAKFWNAALAAGGPYTTRTLVEITANISARTVENAAGRAARFLSAEECEEWKGLMLQIIPLLPDDAIAAVYGLSIMAAH